VLSCIHRRLLQVLSHEAAHQVKQLGLENDLLERVKHDSYFDPIKDELDTLMDPASFIGRAPQQVDKFLKEWVEPALDKDELKEAISKSVKVELSV
jgi:adenylosuccinate lyase